MVADLLGGKPLSSLYCVRHAGLGPKRDTAKHASTQHRESEQEENMETVNGHRQGACEPGRVAGPPEAV